MNQISKPHIVDLLRIFDKNRMISPRIRYASVRSKPELLKDLITLHRAAKYKQHIEGPPRPFWQRSIRNGAHRERNAEVPAPHGHVGDLVLGLRAKDHIVNNNKDLSLDPGS